MSSLYHTGVSSNLQTTPTDFLCEERAQSCGTAHVCRKLEGGYQRCYRSRASLLCDQRFVSYLCKETVRRLLVLGAKACMSLIPGNASLVNRVFAGFLSQLPRSRSDLHSPAIPTFERARMALQTLSELVGDPSIAHRNPRSSLSFSCVTPEVAKSQLESLRFYSKDIDKTYCPLGRDGRPIRKYNKVSFRPKMTRFLHYDYRYSERKLSYHWFHGDNRGISHVGKCARRICAGNL